MRGVLAAWWCGWFGHMLLLYCTAKMSSDLAVEELNFTQVVLIAKDGAFGPNK